MKRLLLSLSALAVFALSFLALVRTPEAPSLREEEGERTGAMAALDFWTQARAFPDKDIPAGAYYRAYVKAAAQRKSADRTLSSSEVWEPIGPTNLHGRTLSVAINPQNSSTVYIGTASGGLWRSYGGGLGGDWQQVTLGYPALGISSIAIDPVDTNIMYIGTGEVYGYHTALGGLVVRTTRGSYGIGILKTTDGGGTWSKSLDWSYNQQNGVEKIAMNPFNRFSLVAATTEGIYKSIDAGANWSLVTATTMAMDLAWNAVDSNLVLATSGNFGVDAFLWKSVDAGNSFFPNSPTTFSGKAMLSACVASPNIAYASIADSTTGVGGLWKSTDFGDTWSQVSNYTTNPIFQVQGWYSHYCIVNPLNPNIVIHNSVPLSKSTDGGVTFIGVAGGYSDNHGYAIDPNNSNVVFGANDDGIYRSTDFGSSWTDVGLGLQTGQLYNGFSCSATDSNMAIGQSQDHIPGYRYLGSMAWDHGTVTDEAGWTAIDQTNDNIQYAVNRNGTSIYRSTNRGASFGFNHSFGGVGGWNSPFVVSKANPAVLYFGDTRIYKTTNSGSTWTATTASALDGGNTALSMAIADGNQDTVIVGMAPLVGAAHVFRTTNGGLAWTNITGTLPNRYPIDLAIDPGDSRVMYAAMGGFGTGHLFKSTDAGGTWTNISGALPDAPMDAICVDPFNSSYLYAGNDIGVWLSTNGGASWTPFSTGLPDAVIAADIAVSPSNHTLRLATHGNGVYERHLYDGTLPPAFDYRALTLNYPADGTIILPDSVLSGLKASFKNSGSAAQTDSFDVRLRILKGGSEVFAATKRVHGLGLNVTTIVTFPGSFTPPDTGDYTVEAVSLAGDPNITNDTTAGTLYVVPFPDVASWHVTKQNCPYTEIVGGAAGPAGDDVEANAAIGFPFLYDGVSYDSVQISTNGWVELGRGAEGSLRGLSTAGQIGGFFTTDLATTNRPTKVLGPWWTDMASGSGGAITFLTSGSPPDRVFTVQWKNVAANYDEVNTTTKLNFQVQLFEGTNAVEYHYGPVVAGTFNGSGAAIGLKDLIGGDFRYYDLANMTTGPAAALGYTLIPSSGWPGQDSCYHIQTNQNGLSYSLAARWNLVSVPVVRLNNAVKSVFPTTSTKAFFYNGSAYEQKDTLVPGTGYWIKVPSAASGIITGDSMSSASVTLNAGWNIIGSVDHEVAAPSGGVITSKVFAYAGSYQIASTLLPGRGYWVKAGGSAVIGLGPQAAPKADADKSGDYTTVTIADRLGRKQALYLVEEGTVDAALYAMPPAPPDDAFDARFAGDRMLAEYPHDAAAEARFDILMSAPAWPLTVNFSVHNAGARTIALGEKTTGRLLPMNGEGTLTLRSGGGLYLDVRPGRGTPASFALAQNYPNPFNPATNVSFDVPVRSRVVLKVYDILGREVATLADGMYDAGSYSVRADFSSRATGVYLYRLTAGDYSAVKKLLFAK